MKTTFRGSDGRLWDYSGGQCVLVEESNQPTKRATTPVKVRIALALVKAGHAPDVAASNAQLSPNERAIFDASR